MIGPTGVGKTEIARRPGPSGQRPFIKIEATKFSEVGYVGRDVDTIIRDLVEIAIKSQREKAIKGVRAPGCWSRRGPRPRRPPAAGPQRRFLPRTTARRKITRPARNFAKAAGRRTQRQGDRYRGLGAPSMQAEIFAPPGMEELTQQIQGMFQNLGAAARSRAS